MFIYLSLVLKKPLKLVENYSVFHRFRQAKFASGGSNLSSSQFLLQPQPPLNMMLIIKVVKIDSKIIISLPWSKSVKHTVGFNFINILHAAFAPTFLRQ
jgi:hypothetical protein